MAGRGYTIGLDGSHIKPLTEQEAEDVAEAVHYIYGQARRRMLRMVADRAARNAGYGWAERKVGEISDAHEQMRQILEDAREKRSSLLDDTIDRAAVTGSQKFYHDTQAMLGNVAHINPAGQRTAYILSDLNNTLDAGERRILRQFDDDYADIIGRVSSEMATGVIDTRTAVGNALQAFADKGIDGFVDRAGRHWQLDDYAEMAVLTAIERATISTYVDTMQSYGFDLAQIDGHAGSCPICAAWEGVVISVSGENGEYPSMADAEDAGCFHPRCLHGITTYYGDELNAMKAPREMEEPEKQYTTQSKLRYAERQAEKYRNREIVAQTPQQLQQARTKAKQWEDLADELEEELEENKALPKDGNRDTMSAGGIPVDLQMFAERDLQRQRTSSLAKGIKAMQERIAEHEAKIKDPSHYISRWDDMSQNEKDGLLRHWQHEVEIFKKNIANRELELARRGEAQ